jgi:hypothetical protein
MKLKKISNQYEIGFQAEETDKKNFKAMKLIFVFSIFLLSTVTLIECASKNLKLDIVEKNVICSEETKALEICVKSISNEKGSWFVVGKV